MDFTALDKRIDTLSDGIIAAKSSKEVESLVNSLGNTFIEVLHTAEDDVICDSIKRAIGDAFLRAAYSKE